MERNPMFGLPAMHSMPFAAHTVNSDLFFTTLTGSSAAHPQPPPYHQGGGGGLPRVLDGGFTAQEANSQNMIPEEPAKRKRGRPRKYGPDGTLLALSQPTASMSFSGASNAAPDAPKKRGRPLGSGKKQKMNALESSGLKLVAHSITVPPGEDVVSNIVSYFQQGSHSIFIISANGVVSGVKLFKPKTAGGGGGIVGYQGLFEIMSLSGTFQLPLPENTQQPGLVKGLTISFSNKDGCVLGGGLAGLLLAATPIQVVVGSLIHDGTNESTQANAAEVVPTPNFVSGAIANTSNLPPRDALSASSDHLRSPPIQNAGAIHLYQSAWSLAMTQK